MCSAEADARKVSMNRFVTYAQNFEDVILWRALKHIDRGFYVDCGAYDPTRHSVTKTFYDRGWRGINIEPIPSLLQEFVVQRLLDTNLAIAISDGSDGAEFYEIAGTGLSTLVHTIAQQHTKAGLSTRVIKVPTTTLSDVLRQFAPNNRAARPGKKHCSTPVTISRTLMD